MSKNGHIISFLYLKKNTSTVSQYQPPNYHCPLYYVLGKLIEAIPFKDPDKQILYA